MRTAEVFCLADSLALPGARVELAELMPMIGKEQDEDGGWGLAQSLSLLERIERTWMAVIAWRNQR